MVENFYDLNTPLQKWNDRLDKANIDHLGNDNVYTSVIHAKSPLDAEQHMRQMGLPFNRSRLSAKTGITYYTSLTGKQIAYHDSLRSVLCLHKDLNQIINPGHLYSTGIF